MTTIWKYEIEPDIINQIIKMPAGALVLSFGLDAKRNLCCWVKVDDSAPLEDHLVACVGTGWGMDHIFEAINRYACFIGSVTRGDYVWHLIDLGAGPALESDEVGTLSGK